MRPMYPRPSAESTRLLSPPPLPLLLLVLAGVFTSSAYAADGMNFTGKSLVDIFWQLEYVDTPSNGHPSSGGQNFTTCCLKAINDAIEIGPDGRLRFASQFENWIVFNEGADQPLDLLVNYSLRNQFPCTAVYDGDARGAPVVQVNYTWLADTCPGWALSSKDNLNAWLQPLSGFLVPAVIFCLSIPRRRKLAVPRLFFAPDQAGIKSYLLAPFGATLALLMVSVDTIVWLCICFAFAGPMILSGLYEAILDNRILEYLKLKIDESRLTLDMRCRCLMLILIGNLDLVWNTDDPSGHGGYVEGSTLGAGRVAGADNSSDDDDDDDDEGRDQAEDDEGDREGYSGGFDSRHDRAPSGEIPLVAYRREGAYQSVPGGDQTSPAPVPSQEMYGQVFDAHAPYAPYAPHAPRVLHTPYAPYSSAYPSVPDSPGVDGAPSAAAAAAAPSRSPVTPAAANYSPRASTGSVSPRSPSAALPPQLPPIPPAPVSFAASALPLSSAFWDERAQRDDQAADDDSGNKTPELPAAPVQIFVPRPPPPIPPAQEYATRHEPGQRHEQEQERGREASGTIVPDLYISPATAGPDPPPGSFLPFNQRPAQQRPAVGAVPGFPPAADWHAGSAYPDGYGIPSRAASPGVPPTPAAQLAVPIGGGGGGGGDGHDGASFSGSGIVAAGVLAAGVGVGVSHDTNRQLLVNHRNGGPLASPWQHMEQMLYGLRLYNDDFPVRQHSPRQYAKHQQCPAGIHCDDAAHDEPPLARTPATEMLIHQTKTRLKTMLHCQYSFGSVVGAPIIFFLGGFIFALLQSLDTLGDEDIAEGLAFGQWYMTIPHISIVSGLLLAGNNPNILEGVLAVERKYRQDNIKFLKLTYGLAYPSCYKVASLWDRGHNKKLWLNTLIHTYLVRHDAIYHGNEDYDKDIVDLKRKTTLSLSDWFLLVALTMLLLGLPFILAFVTAYYTPEIGLSCRSLTFLMYLLVQTCQLILWLWAYAGPLAPFNLEKPGVFRIGGWLDQRGFYQPYSLRWLVDSGQPVPRNPLKLLRVVRRHPRRLLNWRLLWNVAYYASQWTLGFAAIVAAIGGTLMQIVGVYSADICYITTPYWFAPLDKRPRAVISYNSAEMIRDAEIFWKPCAITAIVFMSIVSFVGWWYQRRMRDLFTDQVKRIDQNERRDTRASRPDRGRTRPRIQSSARLSVHPVTPSLASAATASGVAPSRVSYGGYGYGNEYGYGHGRGSAARNSVPTMSGALAAGGSGRPISIAKRGEVDGAASTGGRTPSPMSASGFGAVTPVATNAGTATVAPGSTMDMPGNRASADAMLAAGVDAGAAGPSRRTPYRRTPSPNAPLAEAGVSFIN
ncbi:hypothetical protein SPI_04995 [Niveomyces insectorum RCEF 264]|uniref:Uncharacterized protein n=1 Tax=Niveomyces insectorum RCEF 264 TaxID=1081102 RepID=A0A167TUU5_9HYPO|nr:hypothetical protein SPI_04995 [Niveomyces insectorum RCEF 264]